MVSALTKISGYLCVIMKTTVFLKPELNISTLEDWHVY